MRAGALFLSSGKRAFSICQTWKRNPPIDLLWVDERRIPRRRDSYRISALNLYEGVGDPNYNLALNCRTARGSQRMPRSTQDGGVRRQPAAPLFEFMNNISIKVDRSIRWLPRAVLQLNS